jgi:serine/threonine protein kinase
MLLDFGIAKDVATGHDETVLTHSEGILGTPRYLSPEQALNPKAASPLSDQYALGVMLYECIAGRPPFSAEGPYGLMHAILNAAAEPPSRFGGQRDGELDALVLRAMHREPSSRFTDVRSLGQALEALRPESREPSTRRSGLPDPALDRTERDWSRATPASARVRATAPGLGPGRGFVRDSRSTPPSSRTNPPSDGSGSPSSSRGSAPSKESDSVDSTVPSRLTTGPFYEVTALDARIIRVRRTPREFSSASEIAAEQLRVGLALDRLGRVQKRLLVDSRHAPHSTDERLADAFLALRHEIGRGFERTAVLVASKVGILQATRLNNKMSLGGAVATFDSEREALEFLRK